MFILIDDFTGVVLGKFVSYVKACKARKFYCSNYALDGNLSIVFKEGR
jgi:hypothetical protein